MRASPSRAGVEVVVGLAVGVLVWVTATGVLLVVAGVLVCVTSFREAFSASSRASSSELSEQPTANKS
ncbi:MAG: hypothetical protein FI725_04730 [SAR202 cluster bacterium]|nr:hypothetical protein [SAR202 cluster bacterium]